MRNAPSEIDFLYGSSKVGEKIGKEAGKEKKVTRGGTYADFEAALDNLHKKLTENPDHKGKESGFIYIWTHGEVEQRSDLRQPEAASACRDRASSLPKILHLL
jgi:hypothetical protein